MNPAEQWLETSGFALVDHEAKEVFISRRRGKKALKIKVAEYLILTEISLNNFGMKIDRTLKRHGGEWEDRGDKSFTVASHAKYGESKATKKVATIWSRHLDIVG